VCLRWPAGVRSAVGTCAIYRHSLRISGLRALCHGSVPNSPPAAPPRAPRMVLWHPRTRPRAGGQHARFSPEGRPTRTRTRAIRGNIGARLAPTPSQFSADLAHPQRPLRTPSRQPKGSFRYPEETARGHAAGISPGGLPLVREVSGRSVLGEGEVGHAARGTVLVVELLEETRETVGAIPG
jgi:hypothetical protein